MEEGKGPLTLNLYGGPGAGKSTISAGVFNALKLHDIEVELVLEFAKDLVWEERQNTFKNQQYIFGKQYHRMWRLKSKVPIIVTDSPLLLSAIYGKLYNEVTKSFIKNAITLVEEFDNVNIVLNRVKNYNPNGRNQTETEAKEIDVVVRDFLEEYNFPWIEVPGNYEGQNQIVNLVLDRLGIEQKYKVTPIGD